MSGPIPRHILDLIDCSTMSGPGFHAPDAILNIDEAPADRGLSQVAREAALRAREADQRLLSQGCGVKASTVAAVLDIVREHQPVTHPEIQQRMARQGVHANQTLRALRRLTLAGQVKRSRLKLKGEQPLAVYEVKEVNHGP